MTTQDTLTAALGRLDAAVAPPPAELDRYRNMVVAVAATQDFSACASALAVAARLQAVRPQLIDDLELQNAIAFVAWIGNDTTAAVTAGKRAVRLDPANPRIYRALGWAHLTSDNAVDAFLALSAGVAAAPDSDELKPWRYLSEVMMRGTKRVRFEVDGREYQFDLSTFNGQAMETALHHAHGTFTELEELRFLRKAVGQAKVIVEVGTLVGNHTVFFAKNLDPQKMICFDADPRSIEHTAKNLRLNIPEGEPPALVSVHKMVGGKRETKTFGGRSVEMTTLSDDVTEPVDFIKIDVDGMEMEVLSGARDLFARYRPRAFIEVSNANAPAFKAFLDEVGYTVAREFKRPLDTNAFIVPR